MMASTSEKWFPFGPGLDKNRLFKSPFYSPGFHSAGEASVWNVLSTETTGWRLLMTWVRVCRVQDTILDIIARQIAQSLSVDHPPLTARTVRTISLATLNDQTQHPTQA